VARQAFNVRKRVGVKEGGERDIITTRKRLKSNSGFKPKEFFLARK